jgi:hypothetical protein
VTGTDLPDDGDGDLGDLAWCEALLVGHGPDDRHAWGSTTSQAMGVRSVSCLV